MALISLLTSQHPSAGVLKAERPEGQSRGELAAETPARNPQLRLDQEDAARYVQALRCHLLPAPAQHDR